ncbi:hypothetical protein ONZ45_g15377 [Pleurotus djamor]|nr:hypothetical protein ONZ45_g15377 [Pleurotus djamor]
MYRPSPSKARTVFTYMRGRRTTVPEDAAYCLFGLLGIVLAPAYGEGKEHALYRLQAACAERSDERSLFLWDPQHTAPSQFNSMLPKNPFTNLDSEHTLDHKLMLSVTELWNYHAQEGAFDARVDPSFTFTNSGLRIKVILHDISRDGRVAGEYILLPTNVGIIGIDWTSRTRRKLAILGTFSNSRVFAIILEGVDAAHSRLYRRIPCNFNPLSLPPIGVLLRGKPEKVYII